MTPPSHSHRSRLDTALGRLTMYRLVLWVLAVLAAYSLLLNVLGWLTFGLPEMLAHLALCLGLTYASNRALAALFHVRPHSESSLITGLLLYFLFWPTQFSAGLQCWTSPASRWPVSWRRPPNTPWPGAAATSSIRRRPAPSSPG